jgi:hypothetical protein
MHKTRTKNVQIYHETALTFVNFSLYWLSAFPGRIFGQDKKDISKSCTKILLSLRMRHWFKEREQHLRRKTADAGFHREFEGKRAQGIASKRLFF